MSRSNHTEANKRRQNHNGPGEASDGSGHSHETESVDLVRRAQDGDSAALNLLFARYYNRVRRIVHARIGGQLRARVDSEDIVQQTLVAAVHAFDDFSMRDERSFARWLHRIAENEINAAADIHGAMKRDHRREVALRMVRDAMESGEIVVDPEACDLLPVDKLALREDADAVRRCMGELNGDYRRVIELQLSDTPWAEVAAEMRCPSPDAARMLYARAITKLTQLTRKRDDGLEPGL